MHTFLHSPALRLAFLAVMTSHSPCLATCLASFRARLEPRPDYAARIASPQERAVEQLVFVPSKGVLVSCGGDGFVRCVPIAWSACVRAWGAGCLHCFSRDLPAVIGCSSWIVFGCRFWEVKEGRLLLEQHAGHKRGESLLALHVDVSPVLSQPNRCSNFVANLGVVCMLAD